MLGLHAGNIAECLLRLRVYLLFASHTAACVNKHPSVPPLAENEKEDTDNRQTPQNRRNPSDYSVANII